MLSELGLKGNALAVYAIIYGFSQDGASEYSGSSRYLCEWLGCSKKTILSALAYLTEQGHLEKKTVIKNGVTYCNYVAVRTAQKPSQEGGVKITPGEKNLHQGGVKTTPPPEKNLHQGGEEITPHNTRDNNNYIEKEINKAPAEPPAPPAPLVEDGKKPVKHKYGEYQNVLLTDEEYAKLQQIFPHDLQTRIERLSEYIASKGAKYKSHYATIRSWANRDSKQATPAGRRGHAGPVGPSGIALDPSKNDLAEIF
jgi:hypothetical protein